MTTQTRKPDLTIAREIQSQLGPQTLFLLGAAQLVGGENFLQFRIRGCRRINTIRITLDLSDTYTVAFWHISARAATTRKVSEHSEIYCDQLHDLIERETGLYTTFHAR